jgi:hypothetical protein
MDKARRPHVTRTRSAERIGVPYRTPRPVNLRSKPRRILPRPHRPTQVPSPALNQ